MLEKSSIQSVSDVIYKKSFGLRIFNTEIERLIHGLNNFNLVDVVSNQFKYGEHHSTRLLLYNPSLWENFGLFEWKRVISNQYENEIDIQTTIQFIYKVLQVDAMEMLMTNVNISPSIKRKVLNYFYNYPGNLLIDTYFITGITEPLYYYFPKITERLIRGGANPSKKTKMEIIASLNFE